ncbi:MAG: hypothetical protein IRY89_05455 [Pseudolabrys sp.]|nr:hypothetical protein [Pseudolabrys sp.]
MRSLLRPGRDVFSLIAVRWLAYAGAASVAAGLITWPFRVAQTTALPPPRFDAWTEIERPFPAFALAIPEAGEAPFRYVVLRHAAGGGRKDILALGDPETAAPYLEVHIYRPGREIDGFTEPAAAIAEDARALGPTGLRVENALESKFGPLAVVAFSTAIGVPRKCLGFVRLYEEARLQLSGWFCRGGDGIDRATLACALDRLTLLAAGSDPKIGEIFAQAELRRRFCGQRDPIIAPTPKYTALWKALAQRPPPRHAPR